MLWRGFTIDWTKGSGSRQFWLLRKDIRTGFNKSSPLPLISEIKDKARFLSGQPVCCQLLHGIFRKISTLRIRDKAVHIFRYKTIWLILRPLNLFYKKSWSWRVNQYWKLTPILSFISTISPKEYLSRKLTCRKHSMTISLWYPTFR